jgi:hypothetical protein
VLPGFADLAEQPSEFTPRLVLCSLITGEGDSHDSAYGLSNIPNLVEAGHD